MFVDGSSTHNVKPQNKNIQYMISWGIEMRMNSFQARMNSFQTRRY